MIEEKPEVYYIPTDFIHDLSFLTPNQAIIVYLRDEKNLEFKEIAKILGKYAVNIKRQYTQAYIKIEKRFEEIPEDFNEE